MSKTLRPEPPAPIHDRSYELACELVQAARKQAIRQSRRLAAKRTLMHQIYGVEHRARLVA